MDRHTHSTVDNLARSVRAHIHSALEVPLSARSERELLRSYEDGIQRADKLAAKFGSTDPKVLTDVLDVRIQRDPWPGLEHGTILGTYGNGTITLYEAQIDARATHLGVSKHAAERAVLAHELAHHVYADNPLTLGKGRPWWRRMLSGGSTGAIPRGEAEEIACHAFAGVLADIDGLDHPLELTCPVSGLETTRHSTTNQHQSLITHQ